MKWPREESFSINISFIGYIQKNYLGAILLGVSGV